MSLSFYKFVRKIGQGSYGEVWLVNSQIKEEYVLKKICFSNASEKEKITARSECNLLKQLIHPNIVQYRDSFEERGSLYIVMTYCEFGDLYSNLKERKGNILSEKEIIEWFIQIVMALSYIHERNILHRDLKTQNIFLAKNSVIKIGDFGIAKQLQDKKDLTQTLIGTPYYMSPELFNKKPYNFKSDIWSLGCVTYEIATLKHAFKGKNYMDLSSKIITGQMPDMPLQYSRDLIGLIKAMLNHNPEERPSTNKILRESFIQEHIRNFLDKTRKSSLKFSSQRSLPVTPKSDNNSCDNQSRSSRITYQKKCLNKLPDINFSNKEFDESRISKKMVLEKQIEHKNAIVDIKQNLSTDSPIIFIKDSNIISKIGKKEDNYENNDGDFKRNERQSARYRRRLKNRRQGLKTMLFTADGDVDYDNEENVFAVCDNIGDAADNKFLVKDENREILDNESLLILPKLKRKVDHDDSFNVNEGARKELVEVIEKLNETLSFSNKQKLVQEEGDNYIINDPKKYEKDEVLLNYCDDNALCPEDDCEKTLRRMKFHDKKYSKMKKKVTKTIAWKKLAGPYEIWRNIGLKNEGSIQTILSFGREKIVAFRKWCKLSPKSVRYLCGLS